MSAGKASLKCRQGRQEHFSMTDRIERIAWQRYVKRLHQRLQEPEKLHSGFKPDHASGAASGSKHECRKILAPVEPEKYTLSSSLIIESDGARTDTF